MLADSLEQLLNRPDPGEYAPPVTAPPRGWEPVIERSADEVSATLEPSAPRNEPAEDADLLTRMGLDPEHWKVSSVRRSQWQTFGGEWLESYKVHAVRRTSAIVDAEELGELRKTVSLLPVPPKTRTRSSTLEDRAFVVALSDWQAGKGEGGGSAAFVDRYVGALAVAVEQFRTSRAREVVFVGLGDLVEGCTGFYAGQEFEVDLNRREQTNLVRRLLLKTISTFAQVRRPIRIAAVPGNHGENRKNGKAFTGSGDNDDISVFEQVADVVSAAPEAFGNPTFLLPDGDLTLAFDVQGVRVGLAHGHTSGGGANAQAKIHRWWEKQALGDRPVGGAQLLLTGHFHHLSVVTHGKRTHIQSPAMDGGSLWYREIAGVDSPPGLLTLQVGQKCGPLGWDKLEVIPC